MDLWARSGWVTTAMVGVAVVTIWGAPVPLRGQPVVATSEWSGMTVARNELVLGIPTTRGVLVNDDSRLGGPPGAADHLTVFAGAVAAGMAAGGILYFAGSQLGDTDAQENALGLVASITLGAVGYVGGSVFGANEVGRLRGLNPAERSTLWGGLIGLAAGSVIGFAQPGDNLDGIYLPLALMGPPLGAVIGFFWGAESAPVG